MGELQGRDSGEATFLFLDKAAGTLRRHARGWKVWVSFCQVVQASPTSPLPNLLLDFLQAFGEGAAADRQRSAKSVVAALRFAAAKLQFAILSTTLVSPIISSLLAKDKWTAKPAKEALPLPSHCDVSFERVVATTAGCCCVSLWGSFSLERLSEGRDCFYPSGR